MRIISPIVAVSLAFVVLTNAAPVRVAVSAPIVRRQDNTANEFQCLEECLATEEECLLNSISMSACVSAFDDCHKICVPEAYTDNNDTPDAPAPSPSPVVTPSPVTIQSPSPVAPGIVPSPSPSPAPIGPQIQQGGPETNDEYSDDGENDDAGIDEDEQDPNPTEEEMEEEEEKNKNLDLDGEDDGTDGGEDDGTQTEDAPETTEDAPETTEDAPETTED
ncbi:hypothetical protein BGZ74_004920, partial [Mortierella antarctica]